MKKVAVVVCPNIRNFGSVLQSYATQKAVTKLGYDNEYIKYVKTKKTAYKYLIQLLIPSIMAERWSFVKRKMFQRKNRELISRRNKAFDAFVDKYMTASPKIVGYDALKRAGKNYSMAVLGSDQVWNPINSGSDFYTLNWLDDSTKRVAYAPSFGVSQVPFLLSGHYKKFLAKFDHISVREIRGKKIVKQLTGKKVPVVCDPTLLFTADEWDEIQPESPVAEGKYIFCYFLGNRNEPRKCVLKLAKKTGLPIVMMPFFGEIAEYDNKLNAKFVDNPDPSHFVSAIKNAEYVCTDSYHGTVFSILYRKNVLVFRRHSADSGKNTFSRLESLLSIAGMKDRIVNDVWEDRFLTDTIDYEQVHKNIAKLRKYSWDYLSESLKN
ncbi:Polysaccharide pyruvyl transferase [Ruminococcus sp. YE71]|uniref:polysaccharide pyruvyl transferase family protein n=1 Tax=unclassified Ruminococcus TaxID=2608920 RepID=UPI00088D76B3|nr:MULTISPECIES: polysaccharide pyruvyl transferase family protein [unclassified Ruminococcus]SDA30679.1 Polysaccharide pyruvyl transferase [Ruminococcus sp. YE78]SFW49901.1 Polysaccharide pyruvyl transferase [Ruminococcus sp. YE71]